jgi:aspartate kinase
VTILIIVQKYGGSSIATFEKIKNVANRIVQSYKEGNEIIVVVSAQGATTDELIEDANKINNSPSERELDMLLSIGEQKSAALMAMAIQKTGHKAVSLNAHQVGIMSTNKHGDAKIKEVCKERINKELLQGNIVVITGFQCINEYNDITTLGRGGSDTTAVAVAVATNADLCEIYTDVDGVYSDDPRVVKEATKFDTITYSDMLKLSNNGAKVLHNKSVELAKEYNVKLVVRSSFNCSKGTLVKGD